MTSLLLQLLLLTRQPLDFAYFMKLKLGLPKYMDVTKEPTDTNTLKTGGQERERNKGTVVTEENDIATEMMQLIFSDTSANE